MAVRLRDGSDDPLGLLALAALAALVWQQRRALRASPRLGWLALAAVGTVAATLLRGPLPPLAASLLAVLALACGLIAFLPRRVAALPVVGLAVLCSRILGLAREQIFAALFGGGRVMDAFTIAFRIPNLLRDLFAEGALSTAFVTVFTRTAAVEDEAAAWRLANKVATLAVVTLSAITVVGILSAPWLVAALAPGFDASKAELTVTLTRVMYPFILLVSLAALVMGMLNSRNVFGVPAWNVPFVVVTSTAIILPSDCSVM